MGRACMGPCGDPRGFPVCRESSRVVEFKSMVHVEGTDHRLIVPFLFPGRWPQAALVGTGYEGGAARTGEKGYVQDRGLTSGTAETISLWSGSVGIL